MIRIRLSAPQLSSLEHAFRTTPDRRLRDRAQIVLLAHRGRPIDEALAAHPHLELKRLPSYSPQLSPVERFWKLLRRRATRNRLFDTLADLKQSIRNSLRYFQTVRSRVRPLIANCYPTPLNQTPTTGP